ncbi:metallophosphoesterase [Methylobacterium sp. E-005]|uniref:metallophosphoesterase n=1 Tax=Methylobacterium sp. E-005 TaxID=2836549 RepID=UPI001FBA9B1E|nr:metallophosphoesterase [Methylobacterium sp. E-005]MCJ2087006.1 metallophosphoesterase [Methylobacterium sp. E-005]
MRIWVFSDLHLDVGRPWIPADVPDAEVAVAAGDLGPGLTESVLWLARTVRPRMPVVLVAGNREFHRRVHADELRHAKAVARECGIHLLEDEAVNVGGVRFLGCTLWTDYDLEGTGWRQAAMADADAGLDDHRRILVRRRPARDRFKPADAARLHARSLSFLERALDGGETLDVVVTHHAPSGRSIVGPLLGAPLNPTRASRLDDLVARTRPLLWVHGHVHASLDYRIDGVRVLCNPRGRGGGNDAFDPGLVVEIPSAPG